MIITSAVITIFSTSSFQDESTCKFYKKAPVPIFTGTGAEYFYSRLLRYHPVCHLSFYKIKKLCLLKTRQSTINDLSSTYHHMRPSDNGQEPVSTTPLLKKDFKLPSQAHSVTVCNLIAISATSHQPWLSVLINCSYFPVQRFTN